VDTNGDPIKPQIRIFKNGTEETDVTSYVSWGDFSNNQISAKIDLPYDDTGNSEIVYQIQASYMDGSGNRLEWNGANDSFHSVTQENGYKSGNIILDNLAPEFTGYDTAGDTDKMIGTIPVYQNKGTDGDVTVTFTVEDTEQYWNPQSVKLEIFDIVNQKVVNIQGDNALIDWSGSVGSVHTGKYTFSGESEKASEYRVKISYTDKAGNVQILDQDSPLMIGTMTNGVYTSERFILDHKTPELEFSKSSPVQVLNDIAYYGDSFYVSFSIKEDYAVFANGRDITEGLEDCVLELYKDNQQIAMPEVAWMRDGTLYKGSFQIKKDTIAHSTDGNYQFKVVYQDCADNEISGSSPVMVLDTIAPEIAVSYEAIQGDKVIQNSYNGRDYYGQPVKMVLSVREVNGRYQELQDVLETSVVNDINGTALTGSFQNSVASIDPDSRTNGNGRVWEFNLSTDANYTIPLRYTDLAGNTVVYDAEKVTIDKTEPTFTLDYKVGASGFLDAVNYKDFGFLFADGKLTIKVTASDQTAGIHRIWYTVTDEDGKVTKLEKEFVPSASNVYEVVIPLEKSDFKGSILAEVYDWSANTLNQERGHIVESADRHSSIGSAVITTLTSASRSVGGEEYYNTDVKFNLTFKDTYSGLRKWSYTGGKTLSDSMDYAQAAGDDLTQIPAEAITYEYSQDLTLSASSNNENDIKVTAEFTDNAGHTGSVEQMYHIDVTAPVITVEYDLNAPSNEKFYNQTRTATVT
ncbi:MAG: hypothetical protein IKV59_03430, partial [Lachnospiraceae bacterium]|nr:hypothetical protein [Lachnospiraceae bacterium]